MNIFRIIKECWDEDPKLLIQTVVGGAVLGFAMLGLTVLLLVM
jgi:hypothetical protein